MMSDLESCKIKSPCFDSPNSQEKHIDITVAVIIELIRVKSQPFKLILYAFHITIVNMMMMTIYYSAPSLLLLLLSLYIKTSLVVSD